MRDIISLESYIKLLDRARIIPKIIETKEEYEQFLAVVKRFVFQKQAYTIEEDALFKLIVKLIKDYEEETYNLKEWSKTSPHELLQHLMEARGMKQVDLVGVLSPSKGLVSSIVNGKRFSSGEATPTISKAQAKKLGEIFNISASVFI